MDKYPMLKYFTDRTFGVEVEFFGLNYFITPGDQSHIMPYKVRSLSKDGRFFKGLSDEWEIEFGMDESLWQLVVDDSIRGRGGAELVSPVLKGMGGLIKAYNALRFLNEIEGVKVNETCGFHVHHGVDRELFTCEHLKNLVRLVQPMEELIYLLMPNDRKHNPTCRPVEIDVSSFLKKCNPCNENNCNIRELWYSDRNRFCPDAAKYPRYDKTRYHGLNLHSYWFRSTIEFRYHSAVLKDLNEAMQWVIFTQVLVEVAQGNIPAITISEQGNRWMKALANVFVANGLLTKVTREF